MHIYARAAEKMAEKRSERWHYNRRRAARRACKRERLCFFYLHLAKRNGGMQLSVLLARSDILKFGAGCRRKRPNVTLLDARFLMVSFAVVCVTLPLLPRAEVHFDGANLRVSAQLYLLRA
jgi:hypothetical protein